MLMAENRAKGPVGLLIVALAATGATASEWPMWRGASFDGVSDETGLVSSWSPEGENVIWKADFIGRSTPVVAGGQACVIGRVGEGIERQEVVACYDADNGKKRWEHRFNVYNTTVPFNRVGWASLAADVETGNIYAHGVAGQLIAYDRDGNILWEYFTAERYGRASGYGGRTQTPIIEGDLLIISFVTAGWGDLARPSHRTFAFDKRTGELIWIATPGGFPKDMNTQSVPVVATVKGQRLLIGGNADGWIYALRVDSGEKVWGFHLSKRGINSSVVVKDDKVWVSHSEENIDSANMGRVVNIDATGSGDVTKTKELWRFDLQAGFPSPALHEGRLYVIDNSANLHAFDASNGTELWVHSLGTVGKGSAVVADGKIYATETNGHVHILKLTDEGVEPLDKDEVTLADGHYAEVYGSPAIAYGRVYIATEGGIYCLGKKGEKIKAPKKAVMKKGDGKATTPLIVPAEALLAPGETATFRVRGIDGASRLVDMQGATFAVEGAGGKIDKAGKFTAGDAVAAGKIVAKVGEATSAARVRVIPPLPWEEDFESLPEGRHPIHWVGAAGKFKVGNVDGNKMILQEPRARGLQRSFTYMGPSDLTNITIQGDLMGTKKGRRIPDMGLIAGGYTIDLQGNHQRIQIRSWASEFRMAQQVDFPWELETWYRMKMRVENHGDKAVIKGKVWPRDKEEPADWSITVEDPLPIAGGSPGLVGYAPATVYYDNLKVTVNE
jgi:outer membrane protein assembly factor BamB